MSTHIFIRASSSTIFSSAWMLFGWGSLIIFVCGTTSSRLNQSENSDLFPKSFKSCSVMTRASYCQHLLPQRRIHTTYLPILQHYPFHGTAFLLELSHQPMSEAASFFLAHLVHPLQYACKNRASRLRDEVKRYGHCLSGNLLVCRAFRDYFFFGCHPSYAVPCCD